MPPGQGSSGGRGYLLMKELAGQGCRSVIVASDSNQLAQVPKLERPYMHQFIDGMDFWWIRTQKYQVAKSFRRILSWLHFEWRLFCMPKSGMPKPNAIIVSSLSLLTILNGFLLRRKYKCRLIFEIRDIWPLTLTEEGGFKAVNPLIKFLAFVEKAGYKHSDVVIGTMPNLSEHVCNVLGYERSVFCVPMGFDERLVSDEIPLPPSYISDHVPRGKFIVAHVGSMGIANALDTFLDCAKLLHDHAEIHFLLIGDGDLRAKYERKYSYLKNITFAPKIQKGMVQAALRECDLLYFSVHISSVWRYGQSLNKVIDYMLSGKPIVASYTGFPSMINEAGCGTFVPAGDVNALAGEIIRFSAMDPNERVLIGRQGREWILTYRSYQLLAKKYKKIILN